MYGENFGVEVDFSIENIDFGELGVASLDVVKLRICQAIKAIDESKELREEYAKCFCDELGSRVDLYIFLREWRR